MWSRLACSESLCSKPLSLAGGELSLPASLLHVPVGCVCLQTSLPRIQAHYNNLTSPCFPSWGTATVIFYLWSSCHYRSPEAEARGSTGRNPRPSPCMLHAWWRSSSWCQFSDSILTQLREKSRPVPSSRCSPVGGTCATMAVPSPLNIIVLEGERFNLDTFYLGRKPAHGLVQM